jgi:hypothetical protein
MSVPFGPYALTLEDVTRRLRESFDGFTDPRRGKNTRYTLSDAGLSAFSVFFMQSPSFLEYQRGLEQSGGRSNAQTLFGVHRIPSDNHIRTLLDATEAGRLAPLFDELFEGLRRAGVVERYRAVNDTLLLAFDGTEYFASYQLHCSNCSTRRQSNGRVKYAHTVVTPVLLQPGRDKVIALAPEFVQAQDGADKQDCELNAAKRWLARRGATYAPLGVTVLGDDLYCHDPFCRELRERGMDFILVCKPDSHATLYEWLALLERSGAVRTVVRRRWTGKRHEIDTYRYATELPLRDGEDTLTVNWCELTTTDAAGKVLYHNSWATSLAIDEGNVAEVVAAGRGRWKIENENNNTLKTKGYHFEHNYGHGQQHLSTVLASLILLAFLVHTVLEWMDDAYRVLRQKLPSRRRLFNDIRALTGYLCFESWTQLMAFMLDSFNPDIPKRAPPGLDTG